MRRPDPEWLNAEYDNRSRVADWPRHLDRWSRASALAREGMSRRLDVAYGPGETDRLDIFPSTRSDAPVFVFIHGGYWRALNKRDASFVAPALVAAGAMVVVPDYALCPAVTVEAIALQLARAVAWTYRNAALYGGDPRRIVVGGHSAGGHLAAMLATCAWPQLAADLPAQLLRGALSISGLYDLEPIRHTPFLQVDLKLTAASVRRLSPAHFPAPAGVALYSVVGADESLEFLRQNRMIREAWGPGAVPVCESVPGTNHFTVLHELADPAARVHRLALDLLGLGRA
jgi:arylformamidase